MLGTSGALSADADLEPDVLVPADRVEEVDHLEAGVVLRELQPVDRVDGEEELEVELRVVLEVRHHLAERVGLDHGPGASGPIGVLLGERVGELLLDQGQGSEAHVGLWLPFRDEDGVPQDARRFYWPLRGASTEEPVASQGTYRADQGTLSAPGGARAGAPRRVRAMNGPSVQERFAPQNICFGCGPANDKGLRIRSFEEGDHLVATLDARAAPPGVPRRAQRGHRRRAARLPLQLGGDGGADAGAGARVAPVHRDRPTSR